ncbi:MAG: GST-like protein [Sphingomonadales bacterium RIFCSPHIGHO2_01_FULL_65_20]|uniref:MAPEG family protein n=1 Tax=unclassified Blastomonas TaxID=2626550 RepID=UPI000832E56B|nr:MAPEG family protein [Blastomonas sp.]MCH2239207.1 MAPEG family protein [Blastomonas sp.]OHC93075.1 MAG: GST-like protein [Sphingomonadales bacterium RIFCSPHIGHO2_01_FULL_65_20]
MNLPLTLTMAAAAGLINLWLALRIGQVRTSQKVSVGDGGNEFVIRRMRAQANFVEYTPFVLVLIGALECSGYAATWLWVVGIVYMIGRLAHGLGMDGGAFGIGRMIGTLTSMLTLLGLSGYAIYVASIMPAA